MQHKETKVRDKTAGNLYRMQIYNLEEQVSFTISSAK